MKNLNSSKNYINGINKNTFDLLFNDYKNKPEDYFDVKATDALIAIDTFTRLKEKTIFQKLIKKTLSKLTSIEKISYNSITCQYEWQDGPNLITFNLLSNYIGDEKLKAELTSKKRYHLCHKRSIDNAKKFKNSKVVTGYATIGSYKFLHSIIECDNKVIDWTRNVVMNKSDYYYLTNFHPLSSISSACILMDKKMLKGKFGFFVKEYTTFRDEIMNDLEKNKHLFK